MADARRNRPRSVAGAFLDDLLSGQIAAWQTEQHLEELTVTDLGGGTGTFAITLAEAGHRVTVVDPSLDALASLQRRTSERGLTDRLQGLQGDASELVALVGAGSTDVMVCHRTLEVVDDPRTALAAMAEVVRPGGVLSVLIPQRRAVVLGQALQGRVEAALQALEDPTRFDLEEVAALIEEVGFRVQDISGIGTLSSHVPAAVAEQPGMAEQLYALESRVSRDTAFRAIAPWAHLFARR